MSSLGTSPPIPKEPINGSRYVIESSGRIIGTFYRKKFKNELYGGTYFEKRVSAVFDAAETLFSIISESVASLHTLAGPAQECREMSFF